MNPNRPKCSSPPHRPLRLLLSMNSSRHLLKSSPPLTFFFHTQLISSQNPTFQHFPPKRRGRCYAAYPRVPRPVQVEHNEIDTLETAKYAILKKKLEDAGIVSDGCKIGKNTRYICPKCDRGDSNERSLSLFIAPDVNSATWLCFRAKCGWRGHVRAFDSGKAAYSKPDEIATIKRNKVLTEESIGIEPLCTELLAYFADRMISGETLRRNGVMQKTAHQQIVIAFTYRRNGVLTSCKYRDINKKFWQEKDTEKILYGLDDIKEASDIIIVEGEIDKLSLEEAGFSNCVSVPDGAPSKVSKDMPSLKKDTKYQYLWNCKEYLDKASRIILATDADAPGQALAEELACRLGKERCWQVRWPKKNTNEVYKDANEVLMCLGPRALQEIIDQAELYPIRGLFSKPDEIATIKHNKVITEESIGLEPLCNELLAYFAERMISGETLRRNGVMQKTAIQQIVIAFTCRRNGVLISCKYRSATKKFWQEKDTEKILYGIDDIKDASHVIIVGGEIDKLSMEEAGFRNCVSVPNGPPSKVSKEIPPVEKDTRYPYLWNCKEYFYKASRIILATNADASGHALAEELARRLGKERCWRVKWPKKNTNEVYKDANEVLMCLGPRALQEVIDQAELYPIQNLGYELGTSTELMAQDGSYKLLEERSCYAKNCTPVLVEQKEIDTLESERYVTLKKELEDIGIDSSGCKIGEPNLLICPWCDGGDSKMKCFTLYIHQDGNLAQWKCYRARCGWAGQARVNPYSSVAGFR